MHSFEVPQSRGGSIVMNCQSEEISENIELRIGVVLDNESYSKVL